MKKIKEFAHTYPNLTYFLIVLLTILLFCVAFLIAWLITTNPYAISILCLAFIIISSIYTLKKSYQFSKK